MIHPGYVNHWKVQKTSEPWKAPHKSFQVAWGEMNAERESMSLCWIMSYRNIYSGCEKFSSLTCGSHLFWEKKPKYHKKRNETQTVAVYGSIFNILDLLSWSQTHHWTYSYWTHLWLKQYSTRILSLVIVAIFTKNKTERLCVVAKD